MRIIGVDPGSRVFGYGVVDSLGGKTQLVTYGVIEAQGKDELPSRLRTLHDGLREVVVEFKPDVMSLEDVFHGKNVRSLVRIGESRGVAMLVAATVNIGVFHYPPATVKKALTGTGSAAKHQVAGIVRSLFSDAAERPPLTKGHDATDALALALCHLHRHVKGAAMGLRGSEYAWKASSENKETNAKSPQAWWQRRSENDSSS